jgi:hypothetical protein
MRFRTKNTFLFPSFVTRRMKTERPTKTECVPDVSLCLPQSKFDSQTLAPPSVVVCESFFVKIWQKITVQNPITQTADSLLLDDSPFFTGEKTKSHHTDDSSTQTRPEPMCLSLARCSPRKCHESAFLHKHVGRYFCEGSFYSSGLDCPGARIVFFFAQKKRRAKIKQTYCTNYLIFGCDES